MVRVQPPLCRDRHLSTLDSRMKCGDCGEKTIEIARSTGMDGPDA